MGELLLIQLPPCYPLTARIIYSAVHGGGYGERIKINLTQNPLLTSTVTYDGKINSEFWQARVDAKCWNVSIINIRDASQYKQSAGRKEGVIKNWKSDAACNFGEIRELLSF